MEIMDNVDNIEIMLFIRLMILTLTVPGDESTDPPSNEAEFWLLSVVAFEAMHVKLADPDVTIVDRWTDPPEGTTAGAVYGWNSFDVSCPEECNASPVHGKGVIIRII